MTDCLQIKRREDGQGLGIKSQNEESFNWKDQWWNNAYNNSIKKLNIKTQSSKKTKDEDSESSCSSDDSSSSSSSDIKPMLKSKAIKK